MTLQFMNWRYEMTDAPADFGNIMVEAFDKMIVMSFEDRGSWQDLTSRRWYQVRYGLEIQCTTTSLKLALTKVSEALHHYTPEE